LFHEWRFAEPFGSLEFYGDVAVAPDEIVESADVEFFSGAEARVSQEFRDLDFAGQVGDGLAGLRCKGCAFTLRGFRAHGYRLRQIRRRFFVVELAESEFDVHFDAEGAEPGEVVDDFARVRSSL